MRTTKSIGLESLAGEPIGVRMVSSELKKVQMPTELRAYAIGPP